MTRALRTIALAVLVTGCAALVDTPAPTLTASAELRQADGAVVGTAALYEVTDGVRIILDARALGAGRKAVHIHETGRCDAPDFASARGHFNPDRKVHGLLNPAGPHAGDLPNITIAADGSGRLESMNSLVTLRPGPRSILDDDGSALVIHARPDDFTSDPSGASGDRIACGVIRRDKPGRTGAAPIERRRAPR